MPPPPSVKHEEPTEQLPAEPPVEQKKPQVVEPVVKEGEPPKAEPVLEEKPTGVQKAELQKLKASLAKGIEVQKPKPVQKPIQKEVPKSLAKEKLVEPPKPDAAQKPVSKAADKKPEPKIPVEIIKPIAAPQEQPKKYAEEEATGFFGKLAQKITTTKIDKAEFETLFWELEMSLLESNVALEVIDLIKQKLQDALVDKPLKRGHVDELIIKALKEAVDEALSFEQVDFLKAIRAKQPYVICFVGINGSGKTTTIAKVAHFLQKNKKSCVMAAGDTFRAAAIQQLEEHASRLSIRLIKHDYGADAAAVAFDAIAYAKAHGIDVVLIDTAGRMHSNTNLMDEMKKIIRVAKPEMILFVGESITGNDCIEQARQFNDAVGISGIVLAKADIDEKGGAALSIAYVTGKPIVFLGMGQGYDDLKPFSKELVVENLGLKA
ncbi:signal recognition particle-docking protein FtsY [Candidatus Woesearchaeota archaeon]|nr:signal recognition particle-docking protein FtsY [Candidatus Woesearchaeota archaeon]